MAGARVRVALAFAALLALWLAPGTEGSVESPKLPVAQSVIGPPLDITLAGSSPREHPGETWGYDVSGTGFRIYRYTTESGWQLQPAPPGAAGEALAGFTPARGPLAGSATPNGGVAIVGEDGAKVGQVLVRNPGGPFEEAPTLTDEAPGGKPVANALLRPGETLSTPGREEVLVATVDQPSAPTGVFLVPIESSSSQPQEDVLFYDGHAWSREPICDQTETAGTGCAAPPHGFKVLGIGASSPQNAWLLAQGGSPSEGIVLFSRETAGKEPRWIKHPLGSVGSHPGEAGWLGGQYAQPELSFEGFHQETVGVSVSPPANGQPLTVTSQGIWIDGRLTVEAQHLAQQSDSFTLYYGVGEGRVSASWCKPPPEAGPQVAQLCTHPLESNLPEGPYRSFAWSGEGFGERVITGLGDGVSLTLRGDAFTSVLGIGGASGAAAGAAFASPEEGWQADADGGPLTRLTTSPEPDRLQSWPVPFKHPLTAIAAQPGTTPGDLGAQALAVGDEGEVARYLPGQGWQPETLLNSLGAAQTKGVELRGVAWPTTTRAYALGTKGQMWLWRAETGLWEQDPARPPNLYLANFTGIAFDPARPGRGYAIGQQGVLLCYGKTWQQEPLPPELEGPEGANFTSIAFAGEEALATYQVPDYKHGGRGYTGGVLVDDGGAKSCDGGWHVDTEADQTLGASEVPARVAGLPDGGAVIATGAGTVIERQGQESPWQPAAAGAVDGYPVALAAFREGGTLRAVVSVTNGGGARDELSDEALLEPPPEGQAPVATTPYSLPAGGYLLRETPNGWHDEEHADYPAPNTAEQLPPGEHAVDWPELPDAVLALALDPEGGEAGWAVGGQTGEIDHELGPENVEAIQTAGVMRYPATSAGPPGFSSSPEPLETGDAAFAIGGNAQCATACAELAQDDLGPDAWLENALSTARATGVRDLLYTGPRLAPGLSQPGGIGAVAFKGEEARYARLLQGGEAGGKMEVFAAPAESDLDATGTLASFSEAMGPLSPGGGSAPGGTRSLPGSGAYAFASEGTGGPVWVIVLDYSHPTLGSEQQCWLAEQLAEARTYDKGAGAPAIVIGNRAMSGNSNVAADASQVIPILVGDASPCKLPPATGGRELEPASASAYFFDAPEQNRAYPISAGGKSIPTWGSGTLGYVENDTQYSNDFLGASGFMLAEVETAAREASTNRAPVHVKVIPDISTLSLDATEGVLLRRSHPALFAALARRPPAGLQCTRELDSCGFSPSPYVPIPSTCVGPECATGMFPEYAFTSSNPDVGQFVERDPASPPEEAIVLQAADGKPIPDERVGELEGQPLNERRETIPRQQSGLFCPYNAGTTTVAVHAGGLSYAETITVRPGSVEQPCGTVPLRHPPTPVQQSTLAAPPLAPSPAPATRPSGSLPPPPLPPPTVPAAPVLAPHIQHHRPAPPPPAPLALAQLYPLVALVPPPAPIAARPTPPSGTAQVPAQSPVSQPVGVAEGEEERQGATEMVHHMAAYDRSRGTTAFGERAGFVQHPSEAPLPRWPLGLVLIAAAAGLGLRRPAVRTVAVRNERPKP
ncbi:MAG TPA: hypothetical protein VNV42_12565 [Solirubrobacteraceae bacterium]|nr:hypothetical protein [Solirubrobacteraceae bacterium]